MSYNAKIRADAISPNPIDDALFIKMPESLKFSLKTHIMMTSFLLYLNENVYSKLPRKG